MKSKKRETYKEERPWGGFSQFTHNEVSTVKILKVLPGQRNSLQYHLHRQELWVTMDDNSKVTVGDKTWKPKPFEEVFIEQGQHHRFAGVGTEPGHIMEISFGNFNEDDNTRVEDDYGRVKK